jgi:hypothetical protein
VLLVILVELITAFVLPIKIAPPSITAVLPLKLQCCMYKSCVVSFKVEVIEIAPPFWNAELSVKAEFVIFTSLKSLDRIAPPSFYQRVKKQTGM